MEVIIGQLIGRIFLIRLFITVFILGCFCSTDFLPFLFPINYELLRYGIPRNLVDLIKDIYSKFLSYVIINEGLSDSFQTSTGDLQGYKLSPELFNLFLTEVLFLVEPTCGAHIGGVLTDKLACSNNIDKMPERPEDLQV